MRKLFAFEGFKAFIANSSHADITDTNLNIVVKRKRANGGYLGTQRRRRTWRPTISSGELEASIEPEMSEWGNPVSIS